MSAAPQLPLRVSVAGASGRMGQMLVEAVRDSGDCVLSGALDVSGSAAMGQDVALLPATPRACASPPTWPLACRTATA